jgi:hypothetical protein
VFRKQKTEKELEICLHLKMNQLTSDNITNYSEKICEFISTLSSEEREKAAEVMERVMKNYTPLLEKGKERLETITAELRIIPETEANRRRIAALSTEVDDCVRTLDSLMDKALEEMKAFLVNFSP